MRLKKLTILVIGVFLVGFFVSGHPISTPDYCPICEVVPIDGVCLVNVQTGQQAYLDVWTPHHTDVGKAAPWEQQEGNRGYVQFIGGVVVRPGDTVNEIIVSPIKEEAEAAAEATLCEEHMKFIDTPFVVVDSNVLEGQPKPVYPVSAGAIYRIRTNIITVQKTEKGLELILNSSLYDEKINRK